MKMNSLLICALFCAVSSSAFAAQTLTLTLDAASAGPGKFAAEEIRREASALKEVVAEQALELRLLKKSMIADGGDDE